MVNTIGSLDFSTPCYTVLEVVGGSGKGLYKCLQIEQCNVNLKCFLAELGIDTDRAINGANI